MEGGRQVLTENLCPGEARCLGEEGVLLDLESVLLQRQKVLERQKSSLGMLLHLERQE